MFLKRLIFSQHQGLMDSQHNFLEVVLNMRQINLGALSWFQSDSGKLVTGPT